MKTEQNKTAYLDLFSGIGGFAPGAYWAGLRFDYHYFSEIDDYDTRRKTDSRSLPPAAAI